jgi:hypothetical protein
MPAAQITWQVRRCGTPFTVARHSMQMPMPQSGPRGSPRTEKRHGSLASITAAATLAPRGTRTCFPLTVMEQPSLIDRILLRREQVLLKNPQRGVNSGFISLLLASGPACASVRRLDPFGSSSNFHMQSSPGLDENGVERIFRQNRIERN